MKNESYLRTMVASVAQDNRDYIQENHGGSLKAYLLYDLDNNPEAAMWYLTDEESEKFNDHENEVREFINSLPEESSQAIAEKAPENNASVRSEVLVDVYKTFRSNAFDLETVKAKGHPQKMTIKEWDALIQAETDEDVNYIAIDADGHEIEY